MTRNLIVAALAAICFVAPATAQIDRPSLVVGVADLDLSRPRDVRRLDRRIARAAATVCQPESGLDLQGVNAASQCKRDTINATRYLRNGAVETFTVRAQIAAVTGRNPGQK